MLSLLMRLPIILFMLCSMKIVKEKQIFAQFAQNGSATQNLFTTQTNVSKWNTNPATKATFQYSFITNSTMFGVKYNSNTTKLLQNSNTSTSQMTMATTVSPRSKNYLTGMATTSQTDKIIQLRMGFLMANGLYLRYLSLKFA